VPGYCPGASNIQCCISGGGGGGGKLLGTDVSSKVSSSSYSCMAQNGYKWAVVRAYESVGSPDPNAPSTIASAWAGGQTAVDAYIFPCVAKCNGSPSAAQQVKDTVSHLSSTRFGRLWLDIEGTDYWFSSHSQNVAFIQDMVNECKALGISCGIYTSNSQWSPITGGSSAFSGLPLWYAHVSGFASLCFSSLRRACLLHSTVAL
jgi:GH25 family lysozyme M1 (1,4-beta-N-acetylmuramidase)